MSPTHTVYPEMGAPRKRELVWAGIALALAFAYLSGDDYRDVLTVQAAVERAECQTAKERAAQYAIALTHLLNSRTVVIGETTTVSCRVKEINS